MGEDTMIELETIIRFNDIKDNVLREIGDRFKVDKERARYLVDERKLCVVVKIDKETTKDKPKKSTTKKQPKKIK